MSGKGRKSFTVPPLVAMIELDRRGGIRDIVALGIEFECANGNREGLMEVWRHQRDLA